MRTLPRLPMRGPQDTECSYIDGWPRWQAVVELQKTGCDNRDIVIAAGLSHGSYSPSDPETIAKRATEQREADAKRTKQAQQLWLGAQSNAGTIAESYLRGRSITCPLPDTLRSHPQC